MIYVRAVKGRVARVEPKGRYLPHDKYVPVHHTAYIDRLINVHGDVEVRPGKVPLSQAQPKPMKPDEPKKSDK